MTKFPYRAGDLVECRKGDRRVIDRIVEVPASPIFQAGLYVGAPTIVTLSSVRSFIGAGYQVTVLERASETPDDERDAKYFEDGWKAALREVRLRGDRAVGEFLNEQLGEEK